MDFARSGFAQFMSSGAGRAARIIIGMALIGYGWTRHAETLGIVLMLVGLLPLGAGAFDVCVIGPLFGAPASGKAIRAAMKG
jgi:hypothetical protein